MKFWDEIIAFNNEHFPDWRKRDLIYYSNAIAGEAGEFCGLTKALVGGGTKKKDVTLDKMIFEQLDILIYLVLALERVGVSQVTIDFWFNKKLEIIKERMIVPPKQSEPPMYDIPGGSYGVAPTETKHVKMKFKIIDDSLPRTKKTGDI